MFWNLNEQKIYLLLKAFLKKLMISPTPSEIHLLFQTSRITGENYIKANQGLIFYHVTQDFQRC